MNKLEKLSRCAYLFSSLAYRLYPDYVVKQSCNQDISRYLVPAGTEDEVTYYGKPDKSFRFSDHWNWYSSSKKCEDESMIQCNSVDIPWARKRKELGKPTKPRYGIQVCIYDAKDGCYHHIFGDKFDRKTKTWSWVEMEIDDVITLVKGE